MNLNFTTCTLHVRPDLVRNSYHPIPIVPMPQATLPKRPANVLFGGKPIDSDSVNVPKYGMYVRFVIIMSVGARSAGLKFLLSEFNVLLLPSIIFRRVVLLP